MNTKRNLTNHRPKTRRSLLLAVAGVGLLCSLGSTQAQAQKPSGSCDPKAPPMFVEMSALGQGCDPSSWSKPCPMPPMPPAPSMGVAPNSACPPPRPSACPAPRPPMPPSISVTAPSSCTQGELSALDKEKDGEEDFLSQWLAQKIVTHPSVKQVLGTGKNVYGKLPKVQVQLVPAHKGAGTSEQSKGFSSSGPLASSPTGYAMGSTPSVIKVLVPPVQTRNLEAYATFQAVAKPAIAQAYKDILSQYYELAGAWQKKKILLKEREAISALKEANRQAANACEGSWAGVLYMDSLLQDLDLEISKNQEKLELAQVRLGIAQGEDMECPDYSSCGSKPSKSLQCPWLRGKGLGVWSYGDFWNFSPRVPNASLMEFSKDSPEFQANLNSQFESLLSVKDANRSTRDARMVKEQLESEMGGPLRGNNVDAMATLSLTQGAKKKELEARLAYVKSLIDSYPSPEVEFAFQEVPSTPVYSVGETPGMGLIFFVVLLFLVVVLYVIKLDEDEAKKKAEKKAEEAQSKDQENSNPPTQG